MVNRPLDLSALTDEQFEDLIEAIFRAQAPTLQADQNISSESTLYTIISVSRSGRGQDGGCDLLVTTMVKDFISPRFLRWVVQCKHKAASGRSVSPRDFKDEFSFPDVVTHHHADGYLLVCSTRPSTKLKAHLDRLTSGGARQYVAWDYARVCEEVFKHEGVMKQFFPEEYRLQQGMVDGNEIQKWVRQHRGAISNDALSALREIVDLGAPPGTQETGEESQR
jgi:hypothetical protein